MAGAKSFTIFTKFAVKNGFSGPVLNMAKGADKLSARLAVAGKVAGKLGNGALAVGKFAAMAAGAAVAAGAAIFKLAQSSSSAADEIINTSSALGISTDALQEYRYAGIAAGMTTEEMDAALSKLTINLGKDSSQVSDALYQIGLSADDLKAAGPDKSLEMIASGFATVKDPAKKAAVATALFGKSSVRMVNALSGGPEAVAALRKEAQDIGYVMGGSTLSNAEDLDNTLDRFGATATGLGNRLASKVMPQVTKFVASLSAGIQPGGKFEKIIDSVGSVFGSAGEFIGPFIEKLVDFIPKLASFASGIVEALKPVLEPLMEMLDPILKIFENLMPTIKAIVGVVATVIGPVLDAVKWILEQVAIISTPQTQATLASAPVSSTTSMISSTTNRSTVDFNFGNMPAGASVKQTGAAPGVTLNTGRSLGYY